MSTCLCLCLGMQYFSLEKKETSNWLFRRMHACKQKENRTRAKTV